MGSTALVPAASTSSQSARAVFTAGFESHTAMEVGEGRGRSHTFGQVIGSGGEVTYDVAALDMQSALDSLHVF
jgi:hypothetical protein